MDRIIMQELRQWYEAEDGRILFLCGAPKVGKTWLIEELCRERSNNLVRVSVKDKGQGIVRSRGDTSDGPDVLLLEDVDIDRERNRLRRIILRLRSEERFTYLKLVLEGCIVDKRAIAENFVDEEYIKLVRVFPMNFREYKQQMEKRYNYSELELMEMYLITGGLPQCVDYFYRYGDFTGTRAIQHYMLKQMYLGKASKYGAILKSVPIQLKTDNAGFKYRQIDRNAREREYGSILRNLEKRGILYRIEQLADEEDKGPKNFKIYIYDVGLAGAILNIDERAILDKNMMFGLYNELLIRVFIVQEIYSAGMIEECTIYYWHKPRGKARLSIVLSINGTDIFIPLIISGGRWYDKSVASFECQHNVGALYIIEVDVDGKYGSSRGHSKMMINKRMSRVKPWNIHEIFDDIIKVTIQP